MNIHQASCSCGQLTLRAGGEPVRVSICHCRDCQRRSGSAFAVQARFPAGKVTVEGQSTPYVRAGDKRRIACFFFCPACGTTVFFRLDADPDHVAVALGTLDDPARLPPTVSVFGERQHHWLGLSADIEQYD